MPKTGPGRTPHGNFVLTEFAVTVASADQPDKPQAVTIARATADVEQPDFPIANAFDGKLNTVWEDYNIFSSPLGAVGATLSPPAEVTAYVLVSPPAVDGLAELRGE